MCLKKMPLQLPSSIWDPLYKHGFAKTPEEYRKCLLRNLQVTTIEDTPHSLGLKRAFSAALALDASTEDLQVIFKSVADADLDLVVEGAEIMIHEKWLDFQASHEKASCWLSDYASVISIDIGTFSCEHIVTYLYDSLLAELFDASKSGRGTSTDRKNALRLTVSQALRHMPKMVQTSHHDQAGNIEVCWCDTEGHVASKQYGLSLNYLVTLHRESSCSQRRFDLLNRRCKQSEWCKGL